MDKVLIKDIAEVVNGSTPSTKENSYWDGNIPWITPKDLSAFSGRYISSGERNITKEGYLSCSTTLVPKNTILLTSRAPIGYLAIAKNDLCTNQGFKSLICNQSKVLPLYLFYWLSTKIEFLKSISGGATFKELSKTSLENVVMDLPNIVQQQHIVDTIGSVDDLMEKNTKIITKLSFLAEKTVELVPRKSTLKPLSYFCYSIICGTTPSTKNSQFWMGNIPFITLEDIRDLPFVTSSQRKISEECFIKCNRQLHEGDIITSCIGTVGKVAMVSCDCQTNQQINAVNPIPKYRYYLYEGLKKKKAELLLLSKSGSATPNINKNTFSNICFAIPNDCELDKINSALSLIFKKILVLQKENDTLRKQKNVLLAKYFG